MNEHGDAAGAIRELGGGINRHTALWVEGTPSLLPDGPGMGGSEAWCLNDARQVVGRSAPTLTFSTLFSDGRATPWENGAAYDLNDLVLNDRAPTGSGWTLFIARDINNPGRSSVKA